MNQRLARGIDYLASVLARTRYHETHRITRESFEDLNSPRFLSNPAAFYVPVKVRPKVELEKVGERGDAEVLRFSFKSGVRLRYEESNVASGFYFKKKDRAVATAIHLHGWTTDRRIQHFANETFLYPHLLAEGINVVSLTLPLHMERAPKGALSGAHIISSDVELTIDALRQAVNDVSALTSFIKGQQAMEGLPGSPVGVMGESLGGYISCLAASVERSLDFAAPMIAAGNLARAIWRQPFGQKIRSQLVMQGYDEEKFAKIWRIISPDQLAPRLEPHNILFLLAEYDEFFPLEMSEELIRHYGGPEAIRFPVGHITFFLPGVRRETARAIASFVKKRCYN